MESELTKLNNKLDSKFDKMDSKFETLSSQFNELLAFLVDQFSNVATKEDLKRFATKEDLKNFATKNDLKNEIAELRTEMVTKGEFYKETREIKEELQEVKVIVQRLDRRTDEDVRAVIKDVAKIKTYLGKRGHQI